MTQRWVLHDGITDKKLVYNPVSITSPFPTKSITVDNTSHPRHGIAATIKSPTPAQDWTWTGNLYTLAERDAFILWHQKDYAWTVTDHLSRTWKVLSSKLEIKERRPSARNSTRFTYEWTLLNLGLVVTEES